jgi:hypothetical protein
MLIMHIGYHKTGSSSIQTFLQLRREKLLSLGVVDPDFCRSRTGEGGAHHSLSKEDPAKTISVPGSPWHQLIDLVKRNVGKTVIASAEGFSSQFERPQVQAIQDAVGPGQLKVIVYIRTPYQAIPSRYNQNTKGGMNVQDFDSYFEAHSGERQLGLYDRMMEWASVVGWENMRVRLLDPQHLTRGELIPDFVEGLGLDLAQFTEAELETERRNESLGWKSLEILRAIYSRIKANPGVGPEGFEKGNRRPTLRFRRHVLAVMAKLKIEDVRGNYLTQAQYDFLSGRYLEECAKFNAVLVGPPMPTQPKGKFEARSFMPSVEQIPSAEVAAIMAEMLALTHPEAKDISAADDDGDGEDSRAAKKARRRSADKGEKADRPARAARKSTAEPRVRKAKAKAEGADAAVTDAAKLERKAQRKAVRTKKKAEQAA